MEHLRDSWMDPAMPGGDASINRTELLERIFGRRGARSLKPYAAQSKAQTRVP
jgi:hypothetical protein